MLLDKIVVKVVKIWGEKSVLENDRDEINYHKFLKAVRNSQKVSMEKVALGICCKSEMCRIEAGTRLPDKLVRDRLTARLGISGEEYEEYLLPREYEQWEYRMEIIHCIDRKELGDVKEKIEIYAKTYNSNQVDIQFAEAMRGMVLELQGATEDEILKQIRVALECTVLDVDKALDGAHLLADQELNLIMEYIRLEQVAVSEMELTEWRLKEYDKIVKYIEKSHMDKIAQAKVYSKLACLIVELVLTEYLTEEGLCYALEICTRAVEVLRDAFRLYYFVELNEYRMKLIERIRNYTEGTDKGRELDETYSTSKKWAALLCELYTEHHLPIYMQNDIYLYMETECNNVSEVVRIRRAMMGKSRQKLVGYTGTEKTLMRMELKQVNPLMATVRDALEKVGICAEYRRARIVTSNVDAIRMSQELFVLVNNYRNKEADSCIKKLSECIDMDIPYNEQRIRRQKLVIDRRLRCLDNKMQVEELTDILECTLSLEAVMSDGEKYFTIAEMECISDFATHVVGKVQIRAREILEEECMRGMKKQFNPFDFCVFELIMNRIASIYGNEGKYERSDEIGDKLLKESLRNRRLNALIQCVYNKLWNYQQRTKNVEDSYVNTKLNDAYLLSIIARKSGWVDFLQQKIKELN